MTRNIATRRAEPLQVVHVNRVSHGKAKNRKRACMLFATTAVAVCYDILYYIYSHVKGI